jgi:hypothetical protein
VVELAEVYPSPLFEVLPAKELNETADAGGSLTESVLIRLRLGERGLILGSAASDVVVVVDSGLENGKGSEFRPYNCIK